MLIADFVASHGSVLVRLLFGLLVQVSTSLVFSQLGTRRQLVLPVAMLEGGVICGSSASPSVSSFPQSGFQPKDLPGPCLTSPHTTGWPFRVTEPFVPMSVSMLE